MSHYAVEIKPQAQEDLKVLSQSEPKAYQKALGSLFYVTIISFFYCLGFYFFKYTDIFTGIPSLLTPDACKHKVLSFWSNIKS